jgi:hypothetical protein
MLLKILVCAMAYEMYLATAVRQMRSQSGIGRVHAARAMESAGHEHPGLRTCRPEHFGCRNRHVKLPHAIG